MRVKRLWLAALSILAIFVLATSVAETATAIQLIINGMEVHSDVPPVIVNGRLMVPIRVVSEAMGLVVAWDPVASIVRVDQAGEGSSCVSWKFQGYAIEMTSVFTVDCGSEAYDLHFVFAQETYVTEADFFSKITGNGGKEITLSNPYDPVTRQRRPLTPGQKVAIRFGTKEQTLQYTNWWWTGSQGGQLSPEHPANPPKDLPSPD